MEKSKRSNPSTLADVASAAGVSIATASRVLRGDGKSVRADLVERVTRAAKEVDYVRNILARSLKGSGSEVFGLIVGDMVDPYFAEINESVTIEADKRGLLAVVGNMQRIPSRELALITRLREHRVAGIMLAGGGFDQEEHEREMQDLVFSAVQSGIGVVSLSERRLDVPTFTVDNVRLGRQMAQHVVDNGHNRVAVVQGPRHNLVTQRRLQGIRQVFERNSVSFALVYTEYSVESGVTVADQLVSHGHEQRPTAIIAGSDTLAAGISRRLFERGYTVPEAVSVIGVGNTALSTSERPPFSTMDVALVKSVRSAVDYLSMTIRPSDSDGAQRTGRKKKFPPKLINRGSVLDVR